MTRDEHLYVIGAVPAAVAGLPRYFRSIDNDMCVSADGGWVLVRDVCHLVTAQQAEIEQLRARAIVAEQHIIHPEPPEVPDRRRDQEQSGRWLSRGPTVFGGSVLMADDLADARETIRYLNRRCQLAEAALNTKVEQFEQRSKKALRAYYFDLGRECAANTEANPFVTVEGLREKLEEAEAELVTLRDTLKARDVLSDPSVVWYGPHACDQCGATIIRAALQSGGERFTVPERLLRVFLRGSESNDVALVYPQTWTPHVCAPRSDQPGMPNEQETLFRHARPTENPEPHAQSESVQEPRGPSETADVAGAGGVGITEAGTRRASADQEEIASLKGDLEMSEYTHAKIVQMADELVRQRDKAEADLAIQTARADAADAALRGAFCAEEPTHWKPLPDPPGTI